MTASARTLVIGTRGQLATELHRLASGKLTLLPSERVDVSEESQLTARLDALAPRLIINAAAYTAVDKAESERDRAFAVNRDGPRFLAAWCERNRAGLVHVSTDYVFDGSLPRPYVETDTTAPANVYGASKLAGELAIQEALARHAILRTSWVFSAHGANFVKTMLRLGAEREELRVVADQHGRPTSAADLARAALVVGERLMAGDPSATGTFHFANAGATSWHGLAAATIELQAPITGRTPRVLPIGAADYPTPAKRPANSVLDTSRFEATFGLAPRPWPEALSEVVRELTAQVQTFPT